MITIALRFGEQFAPDCGTISAHQQIIDVKGYVWYGKMGNRISDSVKNKIIGDKGCKILLIRSGYTERYWAHIEKICDAPDDIFAIPDYYRNDRGAFNTWFKILSFEEAPKNILSKCIVLSSGRLLRDVSRHSMSPYFKIEYHEDT